MTTVALAGRRGYARELLRNRKVLLGTAFIVVLLLAALVGGLFVDAASRRTGSLPARLPPGAQALLGTDAFGRSILVLMTEAVPKSLFIGLIAATIGTVGGALVGFAGGYFGRQIDAALRVLTDVFLSVPALLFLILIAALLRGLGGVTTLTLALIIGAFAWAWPARQVRAQVLSLKERAFVQVARLSGMSGPEIIVRELMPHMFQWLGANFVNAFIAAILAEAGLAILGLGPAREMTLGMMIFWAINRSAIFLNLWWWWMTPVFALSALSMSLYVIHLGFDEVSNPRLRARA